MPIQAQDDAEPIGKGSAATVPRGERLIGVDLLRAVAIVQVIAVHINNAYIKAPLYLPAIIVKTHWNDGVTLFFVVSGFLITRAIMLREPDIHRLSLRGFYVRRIARIQPLLLGSIALGAAMLALGFAREPFQAQPHAAFDATFWLSLVTFSFNWLRIGLEQHGFVNQWGMHWDVMWSLAVEEQFYLILPAALILTRCRARFLAVLLPTIVLCAWARRSALDFSSFAGFDALGVGVLTALAAPSFAKRLAVHVMLLGLATFVLGVLMPDPYGLRALVVIGGAAGFILGAQAKDRIFAAVAWRLPARIGELSYELYLLHPMVLVALGPLFLHWSLGFGEAIVLSVVVATLVAHAVEVGFTRPMNVLIRRAWLRPARLPIAESAKA